MAAVPIVTVTDTPKCFVRYVFGGTCKAYFKPIFSQRVEVALNSFALSCLEQLR